MINVIADDAACCYYCLLCLLSSRCSCSTIQIRLVGAFFFFLGLTIDPTKQNPVRAESTAHTQHTTTTQPSVERPNVCVRVFRISTEDMSRLAEQQEAELLLRGPG